MIYPRNVVKNSTNPTALTDWIASNVTIGRLNTQNTFQLNGTASMKQELYWVDFILQPKDFKVVCTFDLTQVTNVADLKNRAYVKIMLRYQQEGDDVFTLPLLEELITPSGNWYSATWYLKTRENSVLVNAQVEVYTFQLTNPLHVTNIQIFPGLDELAAHELDVHPHQLPLAIAVGDFGIKATKGDKVMFWLQDTGDAIFAGALQAASGTFTGDLSAAGGTFTGTLIGVDGTFSGELQAAKGTFSGEIRGGSITSDTDINVTRDISIGQNIYLDRGSTSRKRIVFSDSGSDAYITYSGGDLELFAYDTLSLRSGSGIRLDAGTGDLNLEGDNINISPSASVICDGTWDFRGAREIRGLWTEYTGEHNHGISDGTPLMIEGGGSVRWVSSGRHEHRIIPEG